MIVSGGTLSPDANVCISGPRQVSAMGTRFKPLYVQQRRQKKEKASAHKPLCLNEMTTHTF
jgi:hypothetical protein